MIKPVIKVDEDFSKNLLEELIAAGFFGEKLMVKFKEVKQTVRNRIFSTILIEETQ